MSAYVSILRASSSAVSTTLELRPFRSCLVPTCLRLRSSRWPAALTVCHRQDYYGATPRASSPPMYATGRDDNCSDLNIIKRITTSSGKWLPLSCMILVELINTGTILLGKVAVDQGVFVFALLCYRSFLGAIFTFPFALLLERDKWKPLNSAAFKWILLNSFVGLALYTLPMAMYYYGLRDTTASYAAIFSSLTPLITFILSVIFCMEKLVVGTKAGTAKITGVLLCFGGAILTTFYRGKELFSCGMSVGGYHNTLEMSMGRHQLRGAMLLLGDCISCALWYPIQWKLQELYPCKLWSTFFTCVLGGLQTLIVGIAMRREPFAWKLGWNVHLLIVLYSAALGMATKYFLNLYVVSKRGPAYTSMFSSLSVIFTMLGALILGEKLTVGGLSSATMVIIGLSLYLYGKAKDDSSSEYSPRTE